MPPNSTTASTNGRPAHSAGLSVQLDAEALRPLVREIVGEVLAQMQSDVGRLEAQSGNRLA
jgi:hypothetical protein